MFLIVSSYPFDLRPSLSSSSLFILTSSSFLCRSSLSSFSIPAFLVHCVLGCLHPNSLAWTASQTLPVDVPLWLYGLIPDSQLSQQKLLAGVPQLDWNRTLSSQPLGSRDGVFLVHVLEAHGPFNPEYNHYIGVSTALEGPYLPGNC